jgi:nitric oxide reductase large subunit
VQKEISGHKVEELKAELDAEKAKIELAEAQRELKTLQFEKEQDLVLLEAENESEYQNVLDEYHQTMLADERETQAALLSDKTEINNIQNETSYASTVTLTQAGIDTNKGIVDAELFKEERMADIAKSQKVTATLEHLIG